MDEARRRLGSRSLLAVLAVVLAVGAFWAASAFAAGGSGPSEPSTRDNPAVASVESEGETPDYCPERGDDSESSSDI